MVRNNESYRQGFIDGYKKAMQDFRKINKQTDKAFKPLKDAINKLRRLRI